MSGNKSPVIKNLPTHHCCDSTVSPYEMEWNTVHREAMPILAGFSKINQRSPAPRQKSVHFAPRAIDDELNEFKIKPSDKRHKNNTTALNVTKDSGRNKIPSSSKSFKAGSSCYDLSSTPIQAVNRRKIQDKPIDRQYRMNLGARNDSAIQTHQFKLVAASTQPQYPPRVPSPPVKREPPPTPRPRRLPTPDFEEDCDDHLYFCDCLGCYEAGRPRRVVERERQAPAYLKMENQYQAATVYIRNARPTESQQRQDLTVVSTEDSHVSNLIQLGYPRNAVITALEACRYDFEKLTFVNTIALFQIRLDGMCNWARACPAKSLKLHPTLSSTSSTAPLRPR
ncbi:uncharacterized protein Bfra_008788 [Botrytis fragariae]|uniref:UBA domain-containing protein n=1 Tax=Botrytis fragariae TaxID=1964551 RepID=A0A8H6AQH1_9HELO|nr:uncharacterized protein Bfra_008788 [Botrytis fragariae]KAF5871764.1 hypothetical protein Bfra_008788 [Botrytis fragariae]